MIERSSCEAAATVEKPSKMNLSDRKNRCVIGVEL